MWSPCSSMRWPSAALRPLAHLPPSRHPCWYTVTAYRERSAGVAVSASAVVSPAIPPPSTATFSGLRAGCSSRSVIEPALDTRAARIVDHTCPFCRYSVSLVSGVPADPVATIDDVVAQMQSIQQALAPDDGLGAFNRMYLEVTESVRAHIG